MTTTESDVGNALRSAMANLASGLSVVTTAEGGRPHGSTLSSVISLSVDPPLVLISLARTSSLLNRLRSGGRFGINVLAAHQDQVALRFSTQIHDRFADIEWELSDGAPRLAGSHAWVAAEVSSTVPAGDHVLVIGTVVTADASRIGPSARPLTYWQRQFGTHQTF